MGVGVGVGVVEEGMEEEGVEEAGVVVVARGQLADGFLAQFASMQVGSEFKLKQLPWQSSGGTITRVRLMPEEAAVEQNALSKPVRVLFCNSLRVETDEGPPAAAGS